MTTIITDCGHHFEVEYSVATLHGATMDCRICNTTVIFEDVTPVDENTVRGRDFHEYMNSKNPLWPANGAGTGVVEFGEGLRP